MDDPWATIHNLARDRRLGAAQIAEQAARALADLPASDVSPSVEVLVRGHPEMAPLWRLGTEVLSGPGPQAGVTRFLESLASESSASSAVTAVLPDEVLTISFSSAVVEAIRLRRPARVFCMRSDPGGEGTRMAELIAPWTAAHVVDDREALGDMPAGAVLTGADAVTPSHVVNKVKTLALAEAAGKAGIPCYAVAGQTKFVDRSLPVREPFEEIPLDLFTGIATPSGLLSPGEASAGAARTPVHPHWLPTLDELMRAATR